MVVVARRKRTDTGFGHRLRSIREAKGLGQTELGTLAGMTPQQVAKYERGVSEPSWSVVLRLAGALGVGTDEFRDTSAPDADPPPRPMGKRK